MTSITPMDLLVLSAHCCAMSLLAIGGALAIVPDLQRLMVADMGLLTDAQFNASIAIAQAAPGPNVLFVAVLGFQAAGVSGALAALLAVLLPSTSLAYGIARWGKSRRNWRALRAFRTGMAPIVIALILSTGWTLGAHAAASWRAMALTALVTLIAWRTRVHVLCLIATGALAGALGWI
jgi:chromate transporter